MPIAALDEFFAVAAGTTVVHLQYGVTTVGQHLHFRLVTPLVRNAVRTAMHQHHQRKRLRACRQGEKPVQREAVTRGELDRLHRPQDPRIQPGLCAQQKPRVVAGQIEQVVVAATAVTDGAHDGVLAVAGEAGEIHQLAGEVAGEGPAELRFRTVLIEVMQGWFAVRGDDGVVVVPIRSRQQLKGVGKLALVNQCVGAVGQGPAARSRRVGRRAKPAHTAGCCRG